MEERITREELLERLFHDDYENLKGNIEGGIPDQGSGYVPLAGDVKYKDLNKDGKIDEKDDEHRSRQVITMGILKYLSESGRCGTGCWLRRRCKSCSLVGQMRKWTCDRNGLFGGQRGRISKTERRRH